MLPVVLIEGRVLSGKGFPGSFTTIAIVVGVVLVGGIRGRVGLGTLPNVLSVLSEMSSLSARPASSASAASHVCFFSNSVVQLKRSMFGPSGAKPLKRGWDLK